MHRCRSIFLSVLLMTLHCGMTSSAAAAPEAKPLLPFGARPLTIVCLGDSVTGVYYHTGGLRAYPEMLEIAIRLAEPKAEVKVINAGISGQATTQGLARLDKDVLDKHPDLVTVSFGLNDLTRLSPEQFRENLNTIVARCREAKCQVVLCTPNAVINTGGRPTAKVEQFSEVIRTAGRELGLPVADFYKVGDELRTRDVWGWRLTLSDEIHPNMDGHKLMAEELCRVITGKKVALDAVGPPAPVLALTLKKLKRGEPVRVLAMPPYDAQIAAALRQIQADAKVEVTPWLTEGKRLAQIEQEAQGTVRTMKPDLVVLATPRTPAADADEQFVRSHLWIMNWALSFGYQEWDCFVVHPAVAAPTPTDPRDDLVRRLVKAQHLELVDRKPDDASTAAEIFSAAVLKLSEESRSSPP